MAVYKLGSNKKNHKERNIKKVVGFSMMGISSVIFLFLTGIVKPIQTFLLGILGVFGFPLCVIMLIVGLALVNNRRYVMSKKYTICLILSVFFALCIIQLAIVGNKGDLTFGDYLAKNYLDTWTAGGIIIGLFTTIFLWMANIYGAYIIFSLCFVISVALLLDSLNFLKKEKAQKDPVSLSIKDKKKNSFAPVKKVQSEEVVKTEPVNVVLDGNLKEEMEQEKKEIEMQKPLTARQILGLDKKRDKAYETEPLPNKPKVEEKPKTLREMILTPPEIDIDTYFKDVRKESSAPTKSEIESNVSALKNDEIEPSQVFHEDEFKADFTPVIHRTLPEAKPEELVARADDILRSAIQEEKAENPDIYEEAESINQQNPLDNLPERGNNGSFERRESFEGHDNLSRNNFDRREETSFGRDNFDRNAGDRAAQDRDAFKRSVQDNIDRRNGGGVEDRFARDSFHRDFDKMSARNGTLAREVTPIPEEEPENNEPYYYEKPPIGLITTQSVDLSTLNEDVATKRVLLENTLEMFGVPAKVQGVVVGPAVTRYELEMPQGVSVSKIKNRVDDIALSLAAEGAIRIEAPVPGKSVVGIEVPNSSIATISLKDVLISKEFTQNSNPLTFALGKDITGQTICCNMQKLTHLLVAGSTGSGKSVCLNSIILSILYKASPEDVRIILIDPKRVEFSTYEGIPHLVVPQIIADTQKAISALNWAVNEMERRFDVLGRARVREINEYNQTPDVLSGKVKKMPFIVIIVDELNDLMMTGKKEVEDKVTRLAQKARAAGIHLILATQRPSVDVITGVIKANFPSRISFAVTSAVDSMTILDRVGAEKLLGKGDMLYFPNGAKDPFRVQGCFVSGPEINKIVDYARDNNKPIFDKEIENQINNPNANSNGGGAAGVNNDMDELLPQALKISIECGQASASMLRRKFAIGYPRAARIIDQMEAAGYISSVDGAKGRSVYTTEEEFREIFGDDYD